jgi:hypothetical protein
MASGGEGMMNALLARPRRLGIIAATLATGAGLAFMAVAGAPPAYLAVNGVALTIGLALLAVVVRSRGEAMRGSGAFVLAAGLALLATALFGTTIDGTSRWVRVGVVMLQPSLILLPVMVLSYARQRDRWATAGILVAALALVLQPDRAMAGALFAAMAAVALRHRKPATHVALVAAALGFVVTLLRADTLPPTPFVEQVFASAFAFGWLAGAGLIAAVAALLLPVVARDETAPVFLALWLAIIAAAVLGNYPTPFVGYGGSGVLGYLLGLAALPGRAGVPIGATGANRPEDTPQARMNNPMVRPTPMTTMASFNSFSGRIFSARAPR